MLGGSESPMLYMCHKLLIIIINPLINKIKMKLTIEIEMNLELSFKLKIFALL